MSYHYKAPKRRLTGNDLDDTVLQHGSGPDKPDVTVRDIFNLLAAEKGSTKRILDRNPWIRHETVTLARAFLIANHPELYEDIDKRKPMKDYRILIDENLPARIAPFVRNGFGYITHTNFVGLAGKKDPEVWAWAVDNNIDAIITRDRMRKSDQDLTEIAVRSTLALMARNRGKSNFSTLPLIIHINCNQDVIRTVSRLFNRYKNGIHRNIEARVTPYIKVTERGVEAGPACTDLLPDPPETAQRPRDTAFREWVQKWMDAILAQHNGTLTPEIEKQVRRLVEDSGRQCLVKRAQEAAAANDNAAHDAQYRPRPHTPNVP